MEYMEQRKKVIAAGKRLAETGLIARTWGNISCRVDKNRFLITPSGRLYDSLKPEDIVLLSLEDLSYEGTIKPSSEKGIHQAVYRFRPDINFVIHTHQTNASAVSVSKRDVPVMTEKGRSLIGLAIPIAGYGLPGTKKLKKAVAKIIEKKSSKGIIMAYHGALCFGVDEEEAFAVAEQMEQICEQYLYDLYFEKTGKRASDFSDLVNYYLQGSGESFCKSGNGALKAINSELKEALFDELKARRPDLSCLLFSEEEEILAVACSGKTLKPYLDDFAQIVGTSIRQIRPQHFTDEIQLTQVFKALAGRNAAFIPGRGAICGASSIKDAKAVELVLKKGCRAAIAAALFDEAEPIHPLEASLMRYIYKKKYSRQVADK